MNRCKTCGTYFLDDQHHACPPEWEVWRESDERSDSRTIYAPSPEQAARRWADIEDSGGDYTICGGSPEVLRIAKPGSSEVSVIAVTGEMVRQYLSEPVSPDLVRAVDKFNAEHPVGSMLRLSKTVYVGSEFTTQKKTRVEFEAKVGHPAKIEHDGISIVARFRIDQAPWAASLEDVVENPSGWAQQRS